MFVYNPSPLPDTKYQIVNVESFVGLNGWASTIIRQRCHFLKTHSVHYSQVQHRAIPMGGNQYRKRGFFGDLKSLEANTSAGNPDMDL